jgi:hypothetical protein
MGNNQYELANMYMSCSSWWFYLPYHFYSPLTPSLPPTPKHTHPSPSSTKCVLIEYIEMVVERLFTGFMVCLV